MKAYALMGVVAVGMAVVCQAQWFDQLLNDYAVTNETGQIIVLHDGDGSFGNDPASTAEAVFDGNINTFYDAERYQGAWVGFELETPKVVTRVRYTGRQHLTWRINGTLVQGANTSTFEDAVTLGTLSAPEPQYWDGLSWRIENLHSLAVLQPYKFVRFFCANGDSRGGNFSGFEFYGCDPDTVANPPAAPAVTLDDCINWRFNLRWDGEQEVLAYEIQRKIADEADFVALDTMFYLGNGRKEWCDTSLLLFCETYHRIRALNPMGASDWVTLTNAPLNAATGAWLGTPGSYDNGGGTGDRAFDGRINTFFDAPNISDGHGTWTGLDFGVPQTILAVRFLPRFEYANRMPWGEFEAADTPDFLNAESLHLVSYEPSNAYITDVPLDPPVTARYARYCSPNDGWGNVAEVEFVLAPCAPNRPAGLRVDPVDMQNTDAVLTWSLSIGSVVSSCMVYRATSPGGPYTCLTPDGLFARTWTDSGLLSGVCYYYRVSALLNTSGAPLEGEMCGYVTYIPSMRLERSWDDLTQIKYSEGMALIGLGNPYNSDPNVDVQAMFDNNLSSYVDTGGRNAPIGVDLAKPYCIRFVRFAARAGWEGRLNGAQLRGSNDPSYLNTYTVLMTFQGSISETLVTQQTTNCEPFRYIYILRADDAEFFGNITELELYGWDPTLVGPMLTAPVALTSQTLPSGAIVLAWQLGEGQDALRVESRPAGSNAGWTTLATLGATETVFTDTTATLGQTYEFRVTAVQGNGGSETLAQSDSRFATAYLAGAGTGLMAYYYAPFYPGYSYAEQLIGSGLEPAPDWALNAGTPVRSDLPQTTIDFRAVWYGDLHIPFSGTYTLYARSDDGVALSLDGVTLINSWHSRGAATDSVTLHLAAGMHLLRIDYFQGASDKAMKLEWGGAVWREVIPSAQLYPRTDLPEGTGINLKIGDWEGRTFNMPRLGFHTANPAGDAFILGALGSDVNDNVEGYQFLWQKIRGDFLFEATVEIDIDPLRPSAKAMLMCRNELPVGSPFLALTCVADTPDGRLNVKQRLEQNTNISNVFPQWAEHIPNPCHLRVKRSRGTFEMQYRYASTDPWSTLHTFPDTEEIFAENLYVGLALTSPVGLSIAPLQEQKATFSAVTLKRIGLGTVLIMR